MKKILCRWTDNKVLLAGIICLAVITLHVSGSFAADDKIPRPIVPEFTLSSVYPFSQTAVPKDTSNVARPPKITPLDGSCAPILTEKPLWTPVDWTKPDINKAVRVIPVGFSEVEAVSFYGYKPLPLLRNVIVETDTAFYISESKSVKMGTPGWARWFIPQSQLEISSPGGKVGEYGLFALETLDPTVIVDGLVIKVAAPNTGKVGELRYPPDFSGLEVIDRSGNRGEIGKEGLGGEPGKEGKPGAFGNLGFNGSDGSRGGTDGAEGRAGNRGNQGGAGKPGTPGGDGKPGKNGGNGVLGANAKQLNIKISEIRSQYYQGSFALLEISQDKKIQKYVLPLGSPLLIRANGGDGGGGGKGGAGGAGGKGGFGGAGGDGGKGGRGGNGANGAKGRDGSNATQSSSGEDGEQGGSGGNGGDGGDGGDGGQGGDGGRGGMGGMGGMGGAGGNGGNGAEVTVAALGTLDFLNKLKETISFEVNGGAGGEPGEGGAGGAGGLGSEGGKGGEGGTSGSAGEGGQGGEGGKGGRFYGWVESYTYYIGNQAVSQPIPKMNPGGSDGMSGMSGNSGMDGHEGRDGENGNRGENGPEGQAGPPGKGGQPGKPGKVVVNPSVIQ